MLLSNAPTEFGFSLNPKKIAKFAVHEITHPVATIKQGARGIAHPIKSIKFVARESADAAKQVAGGLVKPFEFIALTATKPIRNLVHKLRDRRAAKLAWDRRKSKTPDAKDRADAKSWTKSKLKSQGPQGYLLQFFAGAPAGEMVFGDYEVHPSGLGFDPATATVIAASIPVFMALINALLNKAAKSGEAPANPYVDAATAETQDAAAAAATPGAVDVGPAQDAAAEAQTAAEEAAGGEPGEAGAKRHGMQSLIPKGVKKSHMMIGAAVLAGVLLLLVLKPKPKKKD